MGEMLTVTRHKPAFTRDQIISFTDLQRKWRTVVEPRLDEKQFLLVFSGSEPRTAILPYDNFEQLWQKAEESVELALQLELVTRLLSRALSKDALPSLSDVVLKAGITADELEAAPDVELEAE
ncbi:MAG: hypothetical protein AB1774_10800 [Bacillota bacterium]